LSLFRYNCEPHLYGLRGKSNSDLIAEEFISRVFLLQTYLPPFFEDSQRLAKVQAVFPKIDEIYKQYAEKNNFPGYAYGILLDGQLVHCGSGGFIDVDKKIPATPQSMFRVASMTKSLTAMAIVKLRDEGKLRLDDPVAHYIHEMKGQRLTQDAPEMTIGDLLMHTAGFPTDDPWADRELELREEDLVALLKRGLFFSNSTGATFEYSNLGYAILGYLVKKITGTSCQEFIDTMICQPLGMRSYWEYSEIPKAELARGYSFKNHEWEEETLLHDGMFAPMGGFITSIESFARYVALHQAAWPPRDDKESGLIKRSSLREMHQPWKFVKLEPFKYTSGNEEVLMRTYGYGLRSVRDASGRFFVGHGGGLPGFGSNWCFLPEHGLGIVSFANVTYANTFNSDLDVLDTLLVEANLQPRQTPPSHQLKTSQNHLLANLPDWEHVGSGVFAANFFLDGSLEARRKETKEYFAKAGPIISVGEVIPENQLRGSFILKGEKADVHVSFALTPENPPLIHECKLKINF
jgi:CubicO group peptidase (beta-lactamase class C family)